MTEKLNADKMVMPCGPLHDQLLLSVKNDGDKITFTFDVSVSKTIIQMKFLISTALFQNAI